MLAALVLAGCATSSGAPAGRITEPAIAAAYLPLFKRIHFGIDDIDAVAVVIAPGIAATNAHNANLIAPQSVIATSRDYDLLFYRVADGAAPATAPIAVGQRVTAYGQGRGAQLRIANGEVRKIVPCAGCTAPAYFVFTGDVGPGFSGGPVVDTQGKLIGIIFGYREDGKETQGYAYDMSRVMAEMAALHVQ